MVKMKEMFLLRHLQRIKSVISKKTRINLVFFYLTVMLRKLYLLVGLSLFSFGSFSNDFEIVDELFEKSISFFGSNHIDSAFYYAEKSHEISSELSYNWGMANSFYIMGWSRYSEKEYSERSC